MLPCLRIGIRLAVCLALVAVFTAKFTKSNRHEEQLCNHVLDLIIAGKLIHPHWMISIAPNQGEEVERIAAHVAAVTGGDDRIFVYERNIDCCFRIEITGKPLPSGEAGYWMFFHPYGCFIGASDVEQLKLAVAEMERSMVKSGGRPFVFRGYSSSEGDQNVHRRFASMLGIGEPL